MLRNRTMKGRGSLGSCGGKSGCFTGTTEHATSRAVAGVSTMWRLERKKLKKRRHGSGFAATRAAVAPFFRSGISRTRSRHVPRISRNGRWLREQPFVVIYSYYRTSRACPRSYHEFYSRFPLRRLPAEGKAVNSPLTWINAASVFSWTLVPLLPAISRSSSPLEHLRERELFSLVWSIYRVKWFINAGLERTRREMVE